MRIELSELQGKSSDDSHWQIGKNYLIRTVTMIHVGRLEKVAGTELVLSSASWIADTGRFSENLQSCEFNEVECYVNDLIVNRSAIIDATIIDKLPNKTK